MDPAESEKVCLALKVQGACLHWLEEQLVFVCQGILEAVIHSESVCATLTDKLNLVIDQLQISEQPSASPIAPEGSEAAFKPPVSTASLHSLHLSGLEHISGESGVCCPFISQCKLHFEFNAAVFSSEQAKITFIIHNLTGRARNLSGHRSIVYNSLPVFIKIFTQIFQSTSQKQPKPCYL